MPCETCREPGDCEDCPDCLLWPASPDDDEGPSRAPRGYAVPLPIEAVDGARARLTTGARVGPVLRRHRRERSISQRALAEDLGWSRSMVGRAEVDASALSLATIERALARTGHRIAIVPDGPGSADEVTDDRWGVPEMVALQRRRTSPASVRGRHLPDGGRAHPGRGPRRPSTAPGPAASASLTATPPAR
ncbi:helix-turn-helix domain-containing protein [Janibacter limosus]|uniref:helix-turn-helix domain-containing protein n=1 Tax=Janibacter limosus TaxID=53458 RepID=UPI0035E391FE